jgi:serine/threonine protein kinase
MGCCVSRAADAEWASPGVSSKYAPSEEFVKQTDTKVPSDRDKDVTGDVHESHFSAEVLEVLGALDATSRARLVPLLSRNASPSSFTDTYDATNARRIGKGGFSVVYAVTHKETGEVCAAKVVNIRGTGGGDAFDSGDDAERKKETQETETKRVTTARRDAIRAALCEAAVGAAAPSDTVCAFKALIIENTRVILIHEFCQGGSLLDFTQTAVDAKRVAREEMARDANRRPRRRRRGASGSADSVLDEVGACQVACAAERALTQNIQNIRNTESAPFAKCVYALEECEAKIACRRVATVLRNLHASGFAHRDVKLENLLLSVPGDLASMKLADFGFATVLSDEKTGRRHEVFEQKDAVGDSVQGTREYLAPEVSGKLFSSEKSFGSVTDVRDNAKGVGGGGGGYVLPIGKTTSKHPRALESVRDAAIASAQPAVDVWSSGVLTFVMLGGYHPFNTRDTDKGPCLNSAEDTVRYEFEQPQWEHNSLGAKQCIQRMLTSDPHKRITADELLSNKWVAEACEARNVRATVLSGILFLVFFGAIHR